MIKHGTVGTAVKRSDGREFYSMSQAAKYTKCCRDQISQCCKGLRTLAGGFNWEYV